MRAMIISLLVSCLAVISFAEVTPVVINGPLALRDIQLDRGIQPSPSADRYLDDWLNYRINSDHSGQVQNEQQIVVNPTNPDNVVAVWRDFRLGYRRVGLGRSFDGGYTWDDELFVVPDYEKQSDPGLTWHSSGTIYTVVLSFNDSNPSDALQVASSEDGGITWSDWHTAVSNTTPDLFEDKELMACDRSGGLYDGNVYVAWARFGNQTNIMCVRSTDGGVNWDDPVSVGNDTGVQWPVPAIGPDGELYIGWVKYYDNQIRFNRSFDGGVTFGHEDIIVQPTAFASASINPQLLIFAFPAMDVDITNGPHRGQIYIAYTDQWYGDTDIFFTTSTDSGSTWSTPTRINDDLPGNGADQFHPWLVCDENGVLHLIFYDRRIDLPQNLFMDLYYTTSTDAGLSWSANERITTVSSNPGLDSLDSGLIGEYNGLAVMNNVIHPVWTDTREGQQDTYTAVIDTTVSVPQLQEDPLSGRPHGFRIEASPNPFNGEVRFSFELRKSTQARVAIYNLHGREVALIADSFMREGIRGYSWKPGYASSGLYFITVQSDVEMDLKKVLYLK
ncbi:T9SS type A sorting domain-containing protein [bacterium]|nr:T9SS type A sorting domain-containing protein [bacterium]MBU1651365.1 T9SS type A sorting domain-containing protein [bacterium]